MPTVVKRGMFCTAAPPKKGTGNNTKLIGCFKIQPIKETKRKKKTKYVYQ